VYRAVDSTGQAIDFLLTAKRDKAAAKRFLRNAIKVSGNAMPGVMKVDNNPAYPAGVDALKADGVLSHRVVLRQCRYLNNVIEQDHRTIKRRVWLAKRIRFLMTSLNFAIKPALVSFPKCSIPSLH
jgi:transposase, IS6 family